MKQSVGRVARRVVEDEYTALVRGSVLRRITVTGIPATLWDGFKRAAAIANMTQNELLMYSMMRAMRYVKYPVLSFPEKGRILAKAKRAHLC